VCLETPLQHDIPEGVEEKLTMRSPVWLLPPNNTRPSLRVSGRSIMILNVNHKFARANQEKISENMLYCRDFNHHNKDPHQSDVQELERGRRTSG
jgi:hypothetical protein